VRWVALPQIVKRRIVGTENMIDAKTGRTVETLLNDGIRINSLQNDTD
jgi:hypothetical protein